ncbi:hypothetical protein DXG03_001061 [Asterophora parasitica]|uniref:Uncharacterized protein n=1 Tax=Asterophora parasitica TaxID=117018 RepID=A0A9P7G9Y1_9AGAR|nr:hypothetical protein DXG03_001061 [Asterophora parasitica]
MPPGEPGNASTVPENDGLDVYIAIDDDAQPSTATPSTTPRPNRRPRVDDDDDAERDLRHPSQRIENPATAQQQSPLPPQLLPPVHDLFGNQALNNRNNAGPQPSLGPVISGFAITIDRNGVPTMHPLPGGAAFPGGTGAPHVPPIPTANAANAPPNPDPTQPAAGPGPGLPPPLFRDFLAMFAGAGAPNANATAAPPQANPDPTNAAPPHNAAGGEQGELA